MHVEQHHHAPHSWLEFLKQYAMIVLSIVTALGLEHVAVGWHDAAAARDSKARIEAELTANLADLKRAETTNKDGMTQASEVMKTLLDRLKAGTADSVSTIGLVLPMFEHFQIALPSWQRDAWDAAIADQSAGHLAAADLRRYAEVYSTARDMAAGAQLVMGGEWLTRAAELGIDIRLGKVDPRTTANTIARFVVADQQIVTMQTALETLVSTGKSPEAN